ncbi:MAG: ThuA domain-containing protein [Actinomycetota bacterium]
MLRVLVVVGGHPFLEDAFFATFDALDGIEWTSDTRPTRGHDVVVFYDMPGYAFRRGEPPVRYHDPSAEDQRILAELQAEGIGLVFLHHAIAGWPTWPEYGELIGGRFLYQPADVRGHRLPDSGYRFDVTHEVSVVAPSHPVCAGLPDRFQITDELYCFPVFEDSVVPLMRTNFPVEDSSNFFSADLAIRNRRDRRDGWAHPAGSDLVAWAKSAGESAVVYLQFGDGPATYADPIYRVILGNAITWVASPEAREWVKSKSSSG